MGDLTRAIRGLCIGGSFHLFWLSIFRINFAFECNVINLEEIYSVDTTTLIF